MCPWEVLCAWSGACRTRSPFLSRSAQFPFLVAEPRNVAIELVLHLPKLDVSVTVAVLQLERAMSREVARVVLPAESSVSEEVSSDEELPGQSDMWCPLLEAAYHHSIGGYLAMNMCHGSMAALSQTCHFALCVNPVARASTDLFFTLCDMHLEHERVSQEACMQRRYE